MKRLLILMLSTLVALQAAAAQEVSLVGRIFFTWDGDIYSWLPGETDPIRHTTNGHNGDLAISPDGMMLAYTHTTDAVTDELYDGWYDAKDLWVWDLQADTLLPIAVHSADADTPEEWVGRSGATWSPDGMRLAFTEWQFPRLDIMVYDFRDGSTTTFSDQVNFGYFDGSEHQDQRVEWGGTISKGVWTYYADNQGAGYQIALYDDAGDFCAYGLDNSIDPGYGLTPDVRDTAWVLADEVWYVGVFYREAMPIRLIDYQTGEQFIPNLRPWYSVMNPGSNVVRAAPELEPGGWGWTVKWPSGRTSFMEGTHLVFSPSGEQIATFMWVDTGFWKIVVLQEGDMIASYDQYTGQLPPLSGEIVWSYALAQLGPAAELIPVEPDIDVKVCHSS